jgi:hypothetical protein
MASRDIETQLGPWKVFMVKSKAIEVQRLVVPWFIAMYRLSYSKSLKLDVIKQVVMTTAPRLGLIECCKTAAAEFPVGLNDVAKRVIAAAGMYFDIPCFKSP